MVLLPTGISRTVSYSIPHTQLREVSSPNTRRVSVVGGCACGRQGGEKLEKARAVLYPSIGPGHYGAPSAEVRKTARITGNRSAFASGLDRFNDKQSAMNASVRKNPSHTACSPAPPPDTGRQQTSLPRSCAAACRRGAVVEGRRRNQSSSTCALATCWPHLAMRHPTARSIRDCLPCRVPLALDLPR
jgi:hypothetical protein